MGRAKDEIMKREEASIYECSWCREQIPYDELSDFFASSSCCRCDWYLNEKDD